MSARRRRGAAGRTWAGEILFKGGGARRVRAGTSVTGALGDVFKNYADLRACAPRTCASTTSCCGPSASATRCASRPPPGSASGSPRHAPHAALAGHRGARRRERARLGAGDAAHRSRLADGVHTRPAVIASRRGMVGRVLLGRPTRSRRSSVSPIRAAASGSRCSRADTTRCSREATRGARARSNYLPLTPSSRPATLVVKRRSRTRIYPAMDPVGRIRGPSRRARACRDGSRCVRPSDLVRLAEVARPEDPAICRAWITADRRRLSSPPRPFGRRSRASPNRRPGERAAAVRSAPDEAVSSRGSGCSRSPSSFRSSLAQGPGRPEIDRPGPPDRRLLRQLGRPDRVDARRGRRGYP
jgi:hypothetical protein